jgi:hypothetical protein
MDLQSDIYFFFRVRKWVEREGKGIGGGIMEMKFGEFDILCTEQRWTWKLGGPRIGKKEVAVFLFLLNTYVFGDEYRPYFSI